MTLTPVFSSKVDDVTIDFNNNSELQIKGGGVSSDLLQDYSVTQTKIGKIYNYSTNTSEIMYSDAPMVRKTNYSGEQVFKSLQLGNDGVFNNTTMRFLFDVRCYGGNGTNYFLKVNGVTQNSGYRPYNSNYLTISSDIVVSDGDLIEVVGSIPNPSDGTTDIANIKVLGNTELSGNNPFN